MQSQIFKTKIEIQELIELLKTICKEKEGKYIFNNNFFKKAMYHEKIMIFVEKCKSYYYTSKHHYLNRKMTYNNFITILRQILKSHDIKYEKKIKYSRSSYNIEYIFSKCDAKVTED